MAQLNTLFSLCRILLYVIARQNYFTHRASSIFLFTIYATCCWPLTIFSNQNGLLFLLLLLIIEVFFFQDNVNQTQTRKFRTTLIVLVFVPGLIIFALSFYNTNWLLGGYAIRNFALYERLITELRILFNYIGNPLLTPHASPAGLFHSDIIKSEGLLIPISSLISLYGWTLIFVAGFLKKQTLPGIILFSLIFFSSLWNIFINKKNKISENVPAFLLITPISFSILTHQRALV